MKACGLILVAVVVVISVGCSQQGGVSQLAGFTEDPNYCGTEVLDRPDCTTIGEVYQIPQTRIGRVTIVLDNGRGVQDVLVSPLRQIPIGSRGYRVCASACGWQFDLFEEAN